MLELDAPTFSVRARKIRIQNMYKSCPGVPTPADPTSYRGWWPNLKNLVHTVAVGQRPIPLGDLEYS